MRWQQTRFKGTRWGPYRRPGDPTASICRGPIVIVKAQKSTFQCILIDQGRILAMRVAYLPTFALISLCVFLVNKSVEKQKADIVFLPKIIV